MQPRAAAEARIPTEKLVPYAVSEEHERGQLADKRSDTTPGWMPWDDEAGLDREASPV